MHSDLKKLLEANNQISHGGRGLRLSNSGMVSLLAIPLWILDREFLFSGRLRGLIIRREIRKFKPDLLHTMESQNGGYSALRALDKMELTARPKTMLTLFGSDLFWFARVRAHRQKLTRLLSCTDFLQGECTRDYELAKGLGFSGECLPLVPVAGGLSGEMVLNESLTSGVGSRNTIAVKGYGGKWGLGIEVLRSLAHSKIDLSGFTLEVFSASRSIEKYVYKTFLGDAPKVIVHKKFGLQHSEMLRLFKRSRVYIGASRSDGLPASMLEAMSQGAFPIQTSTACTDGWFNDGISGFAVEPDELGELPALLTKALEDDSFIEKASIANLRTIRARYSDQSISAQIEKIYYRVIDI
jgi:hypothetical protein